MLKKWFGQIGSSVAGEVGKTVGGYLVGGLLLGWAGLNKFLSFTAPVWVYLLVMVAFGLLHLAVRKYRSKPRAKLCSSNSGFGAFELFWMGYPDGKAEDFHAQCSNCDADVPFEEPAPEVTRLRCRLCGAAWEKPVSNAAFKEEEAIRIKAAHRKAQKAKFAK